MKYDICIIGAGIAGLTASIYARRAGLTALIIEKNIYGGQMVESSEIENYPGISKTTGPELSAAVYEQADRLGAVLEFDSLNKIEKSEEGWRLCCGNSQYEATAVIIANGAAHRHIGCDGEERLAQRGVSYCATCDGAFYRGKRVAVVGGGNTALEDALFLANMAERVYIIHRRDEFRADSILVEAAGQKENIEFVMDSQVERITGDSKVDGVDVIRRDGEKSHIELSGVFVAIGVTPDTEVFRDICVLDDAGYIVADENGETGVEGLYAAGDCRAKRLRQIVTAAADGANAAYNASGYVTARQKQK